MIYYKSCWVVLPEKLSKRSHRAYCTGWLVPLVLCSCLECDHMPKGFTTILNMKTKPHILWIQMQEKEQRYLRVAWSWSTGPNCLWLDFLIHGKNKAFTLFKPLSSCFHYLAAKINLTWKHSCSTCCQFPTQITFIGQCAWSADPVSLQLYSSLENCPGLRKAASFWAWPTVNNLAIKQYKSQPFWWATHKFLSIE